MRIPIPFALVFLCAAAGLTSCGSAPSGATPSGLLDSERASAEEAAKRDEVRRVTPGELRELLEKGEAVIIDVRTEPQYREGRIRGALLIPKSTLLARLSELPQDKLIVSYCACPAEHLSLDASLVMRRGGRQSVAVLLGGLRAWIKDGLPTESGPTK